MRGADVAAGGCALVVGTRKKSGATKVGGTMSQCVCFELMMALLIDATDQFSASMDARQRKRQCRARCRTYCQSRGRPAR
jgi:hypothetical protein